MRNIKVVKKRVGTSSSTTVADREDKIKRLKKIKKKSPQRAMGKLASSSPPSESELTSQRRAASRMAVKALKRIKRRKKPGPKPRRRLTDSSPDNSSSSSSSSSTSNSSSPASNSSSSSASDSTNSDNDDDDNVENDDDDDDDDGENEFYLVNDNVASSKEPKPRGRPGRKKKKLDEDEDDDDDGESMIGARKLKPGRQRRRVRKIIESSSSGSGGEEGEEGENVDEEKIVADVSHQQQTLQQQSMCVSQREVEVMRGKNGSRVVKLDAFESFAFVFDEHVDADKRKKLKSSAVVPAKSADLALPQVCVTELPSFPVCCKDFSMVPNYVKYVEKTSEEMDDHIEYDMDEEDMAWLADVNEKRVAEQTGLDEIEQSEFELIMDRFEKESYFQSSGGGHGPRSSLNTSRTSQNENANEDALCCICLDGECLNSNVILFCDMCNLAVHQECYGVPYIPEGQWLCRRCIQSPSTPVQCILCPNHKTGAYKQTDRGEWVHVVCAIWIPEVHFANTVFLEPVIGVEHIDRARFKLMCSICRRRGVGACIQCDKQNCYTAFHVTCAQQAGLYMNIQEEYGDSPNTSGNAGAAAPPPRNNNTPAVLIDVKKCAYCDMHTPRDSLSPRTRADLLKSGLAEHELTSDEALKRAQKIRMKRTRKLLAERRNAPPVISVPCIPKERLDEIRRRVFPSSDVDVDASNSADSANQAFMECVMQYWLLKRYARNGRPLLRRLQMSATVKKTSSSTTTTTTNQATSSPLSTPTSPVAKEKPKEETTPSKKEAIKKIREEITQCRRIRQEFEKVRLLLEQVRKREKIKRELVHIDRLITIYEVNPFNGIFLQHLMNKLFEYDFNGYFWLPVDPIHCPTYYSVIKNPMDMEKMQAKIANLEYTSVEQFETDFQLILANCFRFNPKSSPFFKAAQKLKDQALPMIRKAKKFYEAQGMGKTLEELKIDTLALPGTGPPLTGTSTASTTYDDCKSEMSSVTTSTMTRRVSVDQPIEVNTDIPSVSHSTTTQQQLTPIHTATPPYPSRRRSSSMARDIADSSSQHSIKTRSGMAAAAAAAAAAAVASAVTTATNASKLDLIQDEADSSNNKSTAEADVSTSSTTDNSSSASGALSNTNTASASASTTTSGGGGVNRRTNFFKRNKSNHKLH